MLCIYLILGPSIIYSSMILPIFDHLSTNFETPFLWRQSTLVNLSKHSGQSRKIYVQDCEEKLGTYEKRSLQNHLLFLLDCIEQSLSVIRIQLLK